MIVGFFCVWKCFKARRMMYRSMISFYGFAAVDMSLDTFHICCVNASFTLFNIEVYTLTFL
jgi:hypothetical protein